EQIMIVVANQELHGLSSLSRRADADVGGPIDELRTAFICGIYTVAANETRRNIHDRQNDVVVIAAAIGDFVAGRIVSFAGNKDRALVQAKEVANDRVAAVVVYQQELIADERAVG